MEKSKQATDSSKEKDLHHNDFTTVDMGPSTTIEEQLGGEENTQALRDKVEQGVDDSSAPIHLHSELIDKKVNPSDPPAAVEGSNVEGNKNSYNIP